MFAARHVVLRTNSNKAVIRALSVYRVFSSGTGIDNVWKWKNVSSSNLVLHQIARNYAFKSDLKIKWVRPPKIPSYKPEKSGDLEQLPPIDEKQVPPNFAESEELKTADDLVKRLFTHEFDQRRYSMKTLRKSIVSRVKRHHLDMGSAETKIAKMTATIRNFQQLMEENPKNKKVKVNLLHLIDRRKKLLKFMRRWDYKRFEWLLEKLNLVFKASPGPYHWITRKDSLRKLTNKHCEEFREKKLAEYKASLDAQKIDFLKEKIEKLQWIRKEEEECGVEPTISQEDIEKVMMQLKEIDISKQEKIKSF